MKKVVKLLQDVELFRPVAIIDNVYSVIFRDAETQVIIRSTRSRVPDVELWLHVGDNVSRFSKLNHRPELPPIMEYGYLGVESIPWYEGDTDTGRYFLATPVTEKQGLNVEKACISLFVGHLDKCEDKLARWPNCIHPSELER